MCFVAMSRSDRRARLSNLVSQRINKNTFLKEKELTRIRQTFDARLYVKWYVNKPNHWEQNFSTTSSTMGVFEEKMTSFQSLQINHSVVCQTNSNPFITLSYLSWKQQLCNKTKRSPKIVVDSMQYMLLWIPNSKHHILSKNKKNFKHHKH